MPLFSRPSKRKDSRSRSPAPLPATQDGAGTELRSAAPSKASSLGQVFSRAKTNARSSSPLLPVTDPRSASTPDHNHHASHRQNGTNASTLVYSPAKNNTCNKFLLGGSYYPGKDKKRRHHRRRTVWHRIFCSSPGRIAVTTILGAYVVIWHVLIPFGSLVLYYGNVLSGRTFGAASMHLAVRADWLLRERTLQLSSLEQEQAVVGATQMERERIYHEGAEGQETRIKILEKIAPDWWHRNDPPDESLHGEGVGEMKEEDTKALRENPEPPPLVNTKVKQDTKDPALVDVEAAAVRQREWDMESKEPSARQLRTLHTMDQFSNETSCPADLSASDIRTTLVIQASLNRVWVLDETCRRWKDPIVAVVVLTDQESHTEDTATSLVGWKDHCPQLKLIQHTMAPGKDSPEMYPVNHLRNIGLDAVATSFVLIIDVDHVPSQNLDDTIRFALQERIGLRKHRPDLWPEEKEAMVVPAFERLLSPPCTSEADCMHHLRSNSSFIPHTFQDLKACVGDYDCIVFQSNNNWEGHHSTRSETWLVGEWYDDNLAAKTAGNMTLRSVKTVPCFDSFRYEPYVVLRWCPSARSSPERVAPYYDERFHGYGKNKIQHIAHLRLLGYQFTILPQGFIVHNPHLQSKAKEMWNNVTQSTLHTDMDQLYPAFVKELFVMYRDTDSHIVDLCDR